MVSFWFVLRTKEKLLLLAKAAYSVTNVTYVTNVTGEFASSSDS